MEAIHNPNLQTTVPIAAYSNLELKLTTPTMHLVDSIEVYLLWPLRNSVSGYYYLVNY